MGHRNWIAIVDSAYPLQTASGIKTLVVGGDQLKVVETVLGKVKTARHVRGLVHVDKEQEFVASADAPGIDEYRTRLTKLLEGRTVTRLPHEEIIAKQAGIIRSLTYRIRTMRSDKRRGA